MSSASLFSSQHVIARFSVVVVGDTAVNTASPDISQVGAQVDNALGQPTNYKKKRSRQELGHQLWQPGLLRKRAASSWLHLGHTNTASSTKQSHMRNLEAEAWVEATTSTEYSSGAEHHQAASIAQSIRVEDQFRYMAGNAADKTTAIIIPLLLTLVASSTLDHITVLKCQ